MEITVKASRKYVITITSGFSEFYGKVKPLLNGEKAAVLFDFNTYALYKDVLDEKTLGVKLYKYVIPAGETSKNAENYIMLLNKLAEDGFTRSDALITFGGGVVGDLGAFVASTYMRGITLIALPTTLLSMVDSSVGGKTAINLSKGKNLCGTFYQPSAVYINVDLLKTLPEKEIKCGQGEILKYTYLTDAKTRPDVIDEKLIYDCLKIKAKIVERDETESGERKLLNFGHTFGHAIEKASDFKISHGESVAKGIYLALKASAKYFGYGDDFIKEYEKIAEKCGIDVYCDYKIKDLIKIMQSDKKRKGESIDFVLINGDKKPEIVSVPVSEINGYIK